MSVHLDLDERLLHRLENGAERQPLEDYIVQLLEQSAPPDPFLAALEITNGLPGLPTIRGRWEAVANAIHDYLTRSCNWFEMTEYPFRPVLEPE